MEANNHNSFQTYIGTKMVKAMPMGAGDAKRYGANIAEETIIKNCGVAGYLVEYEDGYRSWSPAKTFEGAYRIAETYVDRMAIELEEVGKRICKATEALYLPGAAPAMSGAERNALREQLAAMRIYFSILLNRYNSACERSISDCLREISNYENINKEGGEDGTVD